MPPSTHLNTASKEYVRIQEYMYKEGVALIPENATCNGGKKDTTDSKKLASVS